MLISFRTEPLLCALPPRVRGRRAAIRKVLTMEDFYKNVLKLRDKTLIKNICAVSSFVYLSKGEFLYHAGDCVPNLYLLKSGGLRGYYFDKKGREVTDCFCFRPGSAAAPSFHPEEPSMISAVAYKDSVLVSIPWPQLMQCIEENFEGRNVYERILADAAESHCELKVQMVCGTAAERYNWFLKYYPDLDGEVSDRSIASFLGMNPVTLSRLRTSHQAEMAKKQSDAAKR